MTRQHTAFDQPVVWGSAILLAGAIVWNLIGGDGVDALFLLGLGIGGALLLSARWREHDPDSSGSVLRWSGLCLLGLILLTQVILLVRYLFLSLW